MLCLTLWSHGALSLLLFITFLTEEESLPGTKTGIGGKTNDPYLEP